MLFCRETCWMRLLMMMCCLRMTLTMRPQCENLRLLAEAHRHHMNSVYQKTILQNVPWTCVLYCFPRHIILQIVRLFLYASMWCLNVNKLPFAQSWHAAAHKMHIFSRLWLHDMLIWPSISGQMRLQRLVSCHAIFCSQIYRNTVCITKSCHIVHGLQLMSAFVLYN